MSKKWLKSITEICKDPLKKPVNNEGMNNNISVILHVNKTHALVNVFFWDSPPPFSAVFIPSYAPLGLSSAHMAHANYTFGYSRTWQAYNNRMNIISTQKFYLHKNPCTCYLKSAKLATCCTLIMQLNDMWNLQVPQNDVKVSAFWWLKKCGNLVEKVLKEI